MYHISTTPYHFLSWDCQILVNATSPNHGVFVATRCGRDGTYSTKPSPMERHAKATISILQSVVLLGFYSKIIGKIKAFGHQCIHAALTFRYIGSNHEFTINPHVIDRS